jgi:medium-chain acyl-[acyl-carrier-protein] hydrolase
MFVAALRRLNGIPAAVLAQQDFMRLLLPTLRADVTLFETYRYAAEPPLACPISAYAGQRDFKVSYEQLVAWSCHTRGRFRFRVFPGDHFFLAGARAALLDAIREDLGVATQKAV